MDKRIKLITAALLVCAMTLPAVSMTAAVDEDIIGYEWAADGVEYCTKNGIMQGMDDGSLALGDNLTREQMAKMLVETFSIPNEETTEGAYKDVASDRWSYDYVNTLAKYIIKQDDEFNPAQQVTRQEFAAYLVLTSGLTKANIRNRDILDYNFDDADEVDEDYKDLLCIAVERGYMKGYDDKLHPNDLLTRAEVCTLLYRIMASKTGDITLDLGVKQSETPLVASTEISVEQAKQWAKNRGAADIFIDIADLYWKYGELTGIRPEILYAQAAKETNFGKYTGAVLPEQNNWAGIKTATATGDTTYDHETFATPEDGVRGHFNHMSAYIGLEPIGQPHDRYYTVAKIAWAGSIKTLEQLGGKWCPDLYYGYSILHNYIEPMLQTEVTDDFSKKSEDTQTEDTASVTETETISE